VAQRHPTENQEVTKSSRDIAHSEIFQEEIRIEYEWHSVSHIAFVQIFSIPNPNGTASIAQTSFVLWEHELIRRAQRMQMKTPKQQSTAHTC